MKDFNYLQMGIYSTNTYAHIHTHTMGSQSICARDWMCSKMAKFEAFKWIEVSLNTQ